jgi:voltage-gated potassium channel
MNSFEDTRRQLRVAIIAIAISLPVGVIGYMLIEDNVSLLDAVWLTITTLTTIGYGDVVARSDAGRIFTLLLILFGLGAFALAAQAAVQFFISPTFRDIRQRRRSEHKISELRNHYIICGEGELVDRTIGYLLRRAETRRIDQSEAYAKPVHNFLERILGPSQSGFRAGLRRTIRQIALSTVYRLKRSQTILDIVVVITQNRNYAEHLRSTGLLVIEDDPTDDRALRRAGVNHAQAMMSMLENDTETLLNVLTVRSRNNRIYITAATQEDTIALKLTRVGANNVIAPYDVAGQFLNNATLRPAVNDFFNSILFDQKSAAQMVQIFLWDDSPWIGKRLGELQLRERFDTGVIGLRLEDGSYLYAPGDDYILKEDEVALAVTPGPQIPDLMRDCYPDTLGEDRNTIWQRLPSPRIRKSSEVIYSLMDAEQAIQQMSKHFIICGGGPVLRNALDKLDPERPFVVLSNDSALATEMLKRGFRVILGDPADDDTLKRAGVDRALAIMVSIDDNATAVLTVLNCRTLSKKLLITATAKSDDMIPKLRRAGADRVVSPFRIAAQFVLLATTRPIVSDFLQYVLFNYHAGIETTELYMQDNSPWIGKTLEDLLLHRVFHAGVIGVRTANGRFLYAPHYSYTISEKEVLIVTTPMIYSDELRLAAHGGESKRPDTLRQVDSSRTWTT